MHVRPVNTKQRRSNDPERYPTSEISGEGVATTSLALSELLLLVATSPPPLPRRSARKRANILAGYPSRDKGVGMRDEPEGTNSDADVSLGDFFLLGMPDECRAPNGDTRLVNSFLASRYP